MEDFSWESEEQQMKNYLDMSLLKTSKQFFSPCLFLFKNLLLLLFTL